MKDSSLFAKGGKTVASPSYLATLGVSGTQRMGPQNTMGRPGIMQDEPDKTIRFLEDTGSSHSLEFLTFTKSRDCMLNLEDGSLSILAD